MKEIIDLRHKPPFLYLDEVYGSLGENFINGAMNVSQVNIDRFFNPSLGSLLCLEAFAQLASVLLRRLTGLNDGGYLVSVERAIFNLKEFVPLRVELSVRIEKKLFPTFSFSGVGVQGTDVICEGCFTIRLNNEEKPNG